MILTKKHRFLMWIFLIGIIMISASLVQAQEASPSDADVVRGAQLYDKWFAAVGVAPPDADMPIWSRQSTNTRSGPDTWRCAECHGWDYRGAAGAYGAGSHFTGFPDVMALSTGMSLEEIIGHLKGDKDQAHDFSAYLDDTALAQLGVFLKYGTIDDTEFINPVSLQVVGGNVEQGERLYTSTCAECHGEDGKTIVFRTEGVNEYLGSVANRDPWRFLHRTRFGVAGTNMPVGLTLGWTPADGRDILAYAQTLPTGGEVPMVEPTRRVEVMPTQVPGGPAVNLFTGILTGIMTFAGMAGYALLFIGGFILVGIMVVTILRKRR
jgi:mono/diheme cytochrome c family protein